MAFFANLILFLALSLTIGLGSAWYALENGLPVTTRQVGAWQIWHEAGKLGTDPYTNAYVSRSGWLPITSSHALYYIAKTDNNNRKISADCTYRLTGKPIAAEWWSIGLFDSTGHVMANRAQRYAFNSANTVRKSDGSFVIWLAQTAHSGNWLPISGGDDNTIVMRIFGPQKTDDAQAENEIEKNLPVIERVSCQ